MDTIYGLTEFITTADGFKISLSDYWKNNPYSVPHIQNYNNPHRVTLAQLDLDLVANLPFASDIEVMNKQPVFKYISLNQLRVLFQDFLTAEGYI
jgi:hypothetical protein